MKNLIISILQTILFMITPFLLYPVIQWYNIKFNVNDGFQFWTTSCFFVVWCLQFILLVFSWIKTVTVIKLTE